ncbi:MAG: efflux RND transporter periplasmic adaptor subunit [Gammaproteobacteria bacterium]|nr:efflux RND transporter periplasmic adaptor subunit [Gammaproteobacteria bacterium]
MSIAAGLILALVAGILLGRWWPTDTATADSVTSGEREIVYWQAPMDPNFRRDEPGKSPMGMDLVPVYADEVQGRDPALVSIDPSIVSNLGVRTAPVQSGPLSRRINTVGYVGFDEETMHHVHTRVDGWIENLSVTAIGDPVKQGQVLFELYSPTLVNAQQEYLSVRKSGNKALQNASRDRLIALGFTPAEIKRLNSERTVRQRIRIFATSDGVVTDLGIRDGMYVTPATELMSIASLDRVWVQVEVFERQSAWVEVGQRAEVQLDYRPGDRWQGTVDYVYPALDQQTRTLKVRLRFDNPTAALLPNMFANVTIFGTPTSPVVHVPREALIRGGRVNRVVLAEGGGTFRSQPVVVGIESGDRVEIRSGVAPDDRVVVSGQFLIDSESNIDSALMRMNAPPNGSSDTMDHSDQGAMDHDAMDHDAMDHGAMDHGAMDHSGHDDMVDEEPVDEQPMDHSMHEDGATR